MSLGQHDSVLHGRMEAGRCKLQRKLPALGQLRTLLLSFLVLAAPRADAAFTRPAHWKLDLIQQTYAGTWCYNPGASSVHTPPCTNTTLSALLDAHIKNDRGAGLSIAYYDTQDLSILGGASWANWGTVALPVGVCVTGAVGGIDNAHTTTCRFAFADNDHELPAAHAEECVVNRPQLRVIDGCYFPPSRRGRFRLDDTTNSVLAILGLLLALPGFIFGMYRRYRARRMLRQLELDGGHMLSLDVRGGGRRRRCQGNCSRASSL